MSERYAIYFTLAQNDPLYQLVSQWFGYDFYQGDKPTIKMDHHTMLKPLLPYADYNAKAAIYGFHGTLKAPFRLKPGISHKQLVKILKHFSKLHQPFSCSPLQVQQVEDFLVLMPQQPCPRLDNLAKDCVQTFDVFRDELAVEEIQRRNPMSLSEEQRLMLQLWGYPYVLDEFRFHMTLTDKLTQPQIDKCRPLLESYLQPYTSRVLTIDQISLCYQATEHSPFVVLETYSLKVKKSSD